MDNFKVFMIKRSGPTQFATVNEPGETEEQCPYQAINDIVRKETELAVSCSETAESMKEAGRDDIFEILDAAAAYHNDCAARLSNVMKTDEDQATEPPSVTYQQM